jgi:hypothetical protein
MVSRIPFKVARARRTLRLVVAAVTACLLVIAMPGMASASTALLPVTPVVTATPDTFTFSTSLQYWSVVAVQPTAGADFDLRLLDGSGTLLTGSYAGAGVTDLVAINSTGLARPLGAYQAQVTHFSGTGQYDVMFWEKRVVFDVPTDPIGGTATALGIHYGWPAAAFMIYLQQGQGFRVNLSSETQVFLAGSTPGVASTFLRTRSDLANAYVIADNVPAPNGAHCRVFQATYAGWYSLIVIFTGPLVPPPFNGGLAVFPQRYNPSLGDKLTDCPNPQVP